MLLVRSIGVNVRIKQQPKNDNKPHIKPEYPFFCAEPLLSRFRLTAIPTSVLATLVVPYCCLPQALISQLLMHIALTAFLPPSGLQKDSSGSLHKVRFASVPPAGPLHHSGGAGLPIGFRGISQDAGQGMLEVSEHGESSDHQ